MITGSGVVELQKQTYLICCFLLEYFLLYLFKFMNDFHVLTHEVKELNSFTGF